MVPRGHAGLRFTVTVYHSLDQIESMLTCLHEKALEVRGETEIVIDLDAVAARQIEQERHSTAS